MQEIIVPITDLAKMKKYLRILIGKYPWRVNLYACIDHVDYTPSWEYWQYEGRKSRKKWEVLEFPKLVNCFMLSDYVPENLRSQTIRALEENEDRTYISGSSAAKKITKVARKLLSVIETEEDLIREVLDVDSHVFFGTFDRIWIYASHLYLRKNMSAKDALQDSEKKFDKTLKNRELFFEYWEKGQISCRAR